MARTRLIRGFGSSIIGAFVVSAGLVQAQQATVADAAGLRAAGVQRGATARLAEARQAAVAEAAMTADREAVRALLKQAADVNGAQGDGMTALHWAAMNGDTEMAQMLLFAGANPKATTRIGAYTPLFLASQHGQAKTIELLIKSGADPNAGTPNGTTSLMVAAASGSVDAVKILLDAGVNANAKDAVRSQTALMYAAASNRADVIALLAARGADLKATSKVTDLWALTSDNAAFTGNPVLPPTTAPGASSVPGPGSSAPKGPGSLTSVPVPGSGGGSRRPPQTAGVDRSFQLNELIGAQGGLTPLLFAVRQGYAESADALIKAGADLNRPSAGDKTSPLLMAVINGHFDLAQRLLDAGADPRLPSQNGVTPLFAVLNVEWAPKALYPQPRAYQQQTVGYLDLLTNLLDKGADPNARIKMKVWYSGYSFDLSGVDEIGATAFWRAAYASDVAAMKILVAHGADPNIPAIKPAGRPRFGDENREVKDVSGLPPVAVGGPSVTPLQAAAGVGYAEGFAANSHRYAPTGMLAAVKYLVEELQADVNAVDHQGDSALHNAASRGDVEMILYLVSKGADVKAVDREGRTTADMANGPVQRTQPYPEAVALLEKLGSKNNHKCVSC